MKISANWLREWVCPSVSNEVLAERLTMLGLEVEDIQPAGSTCPGVITAIITAIQKHPTRADLLICELDAAQEKPLTVVCAADNIKVGMLVALAIVGTILPHGQQIEAAQFAMVTSMGKLCSTVDLGLTESADGVLELADDAVLGEPVATTLALDDSIFDISLTPNRGDCLSIAGIAREVAAAYGGEYTVPAVADVLVSVDSQVDVSVTERAACPRYSARLLRAINPLSKTPFWLTEKLRRSGIRAVHPVVDIANFVMLEFGQPLHVFDADKVHAPLNVRLSKAGETLCLLDGNDCKLDDKTLVIADQSKVLALAGIMGGQSSAVTADSCNIILESAYFEPTAIIGRARKYGLHTDSSHRFERGVDSALQIRALERASALIVQICGGQAGPTVCHTATEALPVISSIKLDNAKINQCLGITIAAEEIIQIFTALGMQVINKSEYWQVTPPSWRFDIERDVDLIEEIARFYGYDKLPLQIPKASLHMHDPAPSVAMLKQLRQALVHRGYQEVITYSFVDPTVQRALCPDEKALALENPISPQQSVMRTSLTVGLVGALQYNLNRQQHRVRLFESGLVFKDDKQQLAIAGIVCGNYYKNQYDMPFKSSTIFDLKQDIIALLMAAGVVQPAYRESTLAQSMLHPGQGMLLLSQEQVVGWAGMLHPIHSQRFNLPSDSYLFEIEIEKIALSERVGYHRIPKSPFVRRDIALVVAADIPAGQVIDEINAIGSAWLSKLELFDVYRGEGIDPMEKSLAIGLIFQHNERTLTEIEVDESIEHILSILSEKLGARLRG